MEISSLLSAKNEAIKTNKTSQLSKRRLIFFLSLVLIFSFAVLGRTFYLTIIEGESYFAQAQQNKNRITWRSPSRGIIFDRKQTQLVYNEPQFSLVLSSQELPDSEKTRAQITARLREVLDRSQAEVESLFPKAERLYFQSIVLKEALDRKTAIKLRSQFSDLDSVQIRKSNRRAYKFGPLVAHILGYTSLPTAEEVESRQNVLTTSQVGRKAIEKRYDKILRGKPGRKVIEVNAYGKRQRVIEDSKPKPGDNLVLTLDLRLQKIITEEINKILDSEKLKKAAAVAVDPENGDVLALVSLPSFNNNNFSDQYENYQKEEFNPLLNRVTQNRYPPGSTFKPLLGIAGLEEKIVEANNTINCTGGIQVGNSSFADWRRHGEVDFKKAIAESCNVYFYTLGGGYKDRVGLGIERINKYARKFGFHNAPQIDLPYKKAGLVPNPAWKEEDRNAPWYQGDTYNISIGQGALALTPLHINNMMSFFANKGRLAQPHLLKEVLDQKGETIKSFSPKIKDEPEFNSDNVETVRRALRETVISGTAQYLQQLPRKAAGKTGTAQFSSTESTHGWFSGFAPFDDPELTLTIIIEGGGGTRALPVIASKRILERYFEETK